MSAEGFSPLQEVKKNNVCVRCLLPGLQDFKGSHDLRILRLHLHTAQPRMGMASDVPPTALAAITLAAAPWGAAWRCPAPLAGGGADRRCLGRPGPSNTPR